MYKLPFLCHNAAELDTNGRNLKPEIGNFKLNRMKTHIGVLGPNTATHEQYQLGIDVGRCIAKANATLFCGGLGGMMRAASEGAKSEGGQTVGILPGTDKSEANEFIDIAIPTGLGAYRNALLVQSCDAVIAIHGAYGTLSEISFALRLGVPVVGLHTWEVHRNGTPEPGIHRANSPADAVELALRLISAQAG
jgi:uncharacterized protein (TIGR00725 family)